MDTKTFDTSNFRRLYNALNLKRAYVAEKMDVSDASVSYTLDFSRLMSIKMAIKVRDLTGITIDDLYFKDLSNEEIEAARMNFMDRSGLNRKIKRCA